MLSDTLDRHGGVLLPLECLRSIQQAIKRVEQDSIDQDARITELSGMNRVLEGRIRALEGMNKNRLKTMRSNLLSDIRQENLWRIPIYNYTCSKLVGT